MSSNDQPPEAPEDSIDFAAPAAEEPASPTNPSSAETTSPARVPSLRSVSDQASTTPMSASSTPLGMLNNARRPVAAGRPNAAAALPQDLSARMKAFHMSRQGTPPGGRPPLPNSVSAGASSPAAGPSIAGGLPGNLRLPPNLRPQPQAFSSAPAVPRAPGAKPSLSERRKMNLPGGLPPMAPPPASGPPAADGKPEADQNKNGDSGSMFSKFSNYVDTKAGTLNFAGKAIIHGQGVEFSSGHNFSISLDEVDTLEELGKGNYGTVYKVRHARPRMRKPGQGLAGNKSNSPVTQDKEAELAEPPTPGANKGGTTGIIMAMKELRLELDEAKFAAIIMELDVLHRCVSPYIIDFYGAFFQEGAVYICIEFMDGGSVDKLYGDGVPESVLRKITYATTRGLQSLKDEHNIIHRDVKPTNILVNTRGQVKICDFGVSGNLVASIAKTNIGCQSYMAPERIAGGGVAQAGANPGGGTYSVQSDIWSLGLSVIEMAMGRYPYPPETYNNIFSQLSAIVDGDPPDLPEDGFSELARDFVRGCLNKIPKLRPTYKMLLQHGWLAPLSKPAGITEEEEEDGESESASANADYQDGVNCGNMGDKEVADWVTAAIERKTKGTLKEAQKPALHKVDLAAVSPAQSPAGSPLVGP